MDDRRRAPDRPAGAARSQSASASISGSGVVFDRCQRSDQPRTWRSTKPAGLPSVLSGGAVTSMAWRSASVSIIAALKRRRAAGIGQRRRFLGAHDQTAAALHRVEHRADDVEILAEQIRPRRQREDARASPTASGTRAPCRARSAAPVRTADGARRSRRRRTAPDRSGSNGRRETAPPPARG